MKSVRIMMGRTTVSVERVMIELEVYVAISTSVSMMQAAQRTTTA